MMIRGRHQWADLQPGIAWHGDVDDFVRLITCVSTHCTCRATGPRTCGAHELLAEQHTLDHLVFARGMRQQFVDAEWILDPQATLPSPTRERSVSRHTARGTHGKVVALACAALLLVFGMGGSWLAPVNTGAQLASWQSR